MHILRELNSFGLLSTLSTLATGVLHARRGTSSGEATLIHEFVSLLEVYFLASELLLLKLMCSDDI
jgi:hypothetical protein